MKFEFRRTKETDFLLWASRLEQTPRFSDISNNSSRRFHSQIHLQMIFFHNRSEEKIGFFCSAKLKFHLWAQRIFLKEIAAIFRLCARVRRSEKEIEPQNSQIRKMKKMKFAICTPKREKKDEGRQILRMKFNFFQFFQRLCRWLESAGTIAD